jgi:3-deoxy-7-phosphoheptulonate synthase
MSELYKVVENTNLIGFEALVAPTTVKDQLPMSSESVELVKRARAEVRDVIHGVDGRRLVVIVGPCSIHDPEAALEYAERLRRVRDGLKDRLVILMRTYFEKPRTTLGWKGLINDPHLDGSCDIATGLLRARRTLLDINALGVPCGSEVLDPVTPQYTAELLSWASIGARTTESQTHREMASGLSMPVGFKNGTDGSLDAAVNALISAGSAHSFLGINGGGITAIVKTRGNPDRHVVLRGGPHPNYSPEDVVEAASRVARAAPDIRRAVMVDTSHGNSSKDYTRQAEVCRGVLQQVRAGQKSVMGLLINLEAGRQDWQAEPRRRGVSITDGCIGWDETEALLDEIAAAVPAA